MKSKITICTLVPLLVVGLALPASATESSAFRDLMRDYESIRLLLLTDELDGVAQHARSIEERVAQLSEAFNAADAGVPEEKAADCRALLPELAAAAARVSAATEIEVAREALFELSKPLGRYRKMAGIEGSMVVFCPMAKKAWIQPEGEIGNPYMGREMPTCGRVIAD